MKCRNCIIWKTKLSDNRYVKDSYISSGVYSMMDDDKVEKQEEYFKERENFLVSISDEDCPQVFCLLVKEYAVNS